MDISIKTLRHQKVIKGTEIANTICAGSHGYANGYLLEPNLIIVGNLPVGNEMRGRVYSENGISPCIMAKEGGGHQPIVVKNARIRRFTPKEVFMLMGYDELFFNKCKKIQSDTQLYKQGGNSIVVDTMMHLLRSVLKSIGIIV